MNDEREQLIRLCEKLGAARPQAEAMATQLLKRAEQLAAERGTTREAALARLLELVVQGRSGVPPAEFPPTSPPPAS
jgi:hypothetical protein